MTTEPNDMPPSLHEQALPDVPSPSEMPSRLDSTQIFRGQKTVEIEHGEQRYTLRVTKDNKLILTK
ncbi:MAG TPA: hemin uptake protein HemP [Azospira sp.]|nr:hemin uptake protein HemP [Azospira sp.]